MFFLNIWCFNFGFIIEGCGQRFEFQLIVTHQTEKNKVIVR